MAGVIPSKETFRSMCPFLKELYLIFEGENLVISTVEVVVWEVGLAAIIVATVSLVRALNSDEASVFPMISPLSGLIQP
jgi:hypothetical protein